MPGFLEANKEIEKKMKMKCERKGFDSQMLGWSRWKKSKGS
jgi:hypothetical protein